MSRIDRRWLALIAGAAFALRLGAAVVTELRPVFPAYYYTDASETNAAAQAVFDGQSAGRPFAFRGTLSQRFQVRVQSELYGLIGVHPFVMKLLSCLFGAVAAAALAAAAAPSFGALPAAAAGLLTAVWPSNVFYTSQNFKEAPTNMFALLALGCLVPLLSGSPGATGASAALGAACLLAAGIYRSYVMASLSATLACGFLWRLRTSRSNAAALGLAAALCAPIAFLPAARLIETFWLGAAFSAGDPRDTPHIVPVTYDEHTTRAYRPTSPQALSEFRRIRQQADAAWARAEMGREIGTQIYPEARFGSWLDVLAFLPKAAFAVLFMPLPGAYPLDGKLGRLLAALENLALLAAAALALAGAVRGPKTPARASLLLFFAVMTAGSALLEFDLGSAGRHKLLYLPMLFPFAAEEAMRLLGRREKTPA